MSRCPFAVWKPLPQNDTQSRITPTTVILHSTAGGSNASNWALFDSPAAQGDESHFILDGAGTLWQVMDTTRRADAQWDGNAYAISVETTSNPKASDPWTRAQLAKLDLLGKWLLAAHPGIGRRVCRSPGDPGFGYHRLFPSWNRSGHTCPGNARVGQFPALVHTILTPLVTPGGPDMTVEEFKALLHSDPDVRKDIATAVLGYHNDAAAPYPQPVGEKLDVFGLIRKGANPA